MRRLRLLLDAGVLVDAQVRDVFLGLAEAGLVELRWSEGLLAELRTLLVEEMGRPPDRADRLCQALRGAFPLGEVVSSDEALAARLAGEGTDGLQSLVAAVTAEADLLVSHDRTRFPADDALAAWNLAVLSPDDALAEMVDVLGAERVAEVFDALTEPLGVASEDLLDRLRHLGQVAPVAAIAIGAQLDAARVDELQDYLVAARPDDARAAVSQLVNRVGDGDLAGMDLLLSPAARTALGGTARVRHRRLQDGFFDLLINPGDWAFGGPGPAAGPARAARSGAEVVTLVHRPGDTPPPATPVATGVRSAGTGGADDLEALAEVVANPRAEPRSPLAKPDRALSFAVMATDAGWRVDGIEGL